MLRTIALNEFENFTLACNNYPPDWPCDVGNGNGLRCVRRTRRPHKVQPDQAGAAEANRGIVTARFIQRIKAAPRLISRIGKREYQREVVVRNFGLPQFTRFSRPAQNGVRSSVFSTFPAPDSGNGRSRTSTLCGHL